MRYFPAFVNVTGQRVVVVGGGEKAAQKLRLLLKTEAAITVVAPEFAAEVRELAAVSANVTLVEAAFSPEHLTGARLVFVATDAAALASEAAKAARERGIPVNVVDQPELSSFIVPALVDRDPIVVAIGTEGASPILAQEVRGKLEAWLPAHFGRLGRAAARLRPTIQKRIADFNTRRRLWNALLKGPWRRSVLAGDDVQAELDFEDAVHRIKTGRAPQGRVSLVGAGPGDPDLLTLRAQQRLQEADVIVVDGLVAPEILEHARRDAKRIRVGKAGYGAAVAQSEINQILIREARQGRHVVRLKGGDPFIFGRAVEEMTALRAAGIPVEIVPGITAAHACAASVELPLTQRERIRQFSVVAGATAEGLPDLDWSALARPGRAFAIYMGVHNAPALTEHLLAHGADPATNVVIVENGTRANERAIETRLADLPVAIAEKSIRGPSIIFVGLSWDAANLTRPSRVEVFGREEAESENQRKQTPEDIAASLYWVAG
jgi:uroporphyrin-III C-methyltransferase/precorrin-2 dehydrogenase/sirohydrochlorin ferrochelatase